MENKVKPIALYLPQFHRIPENDAWWGEGFTEWSNVRKSNPRFEDHYQPHIPLLGNYYSLDEIAVMREQASLAKAHGIFGFCFYHYWFNGKLLLEKPLHQWLEASDIEFPYCLSWANENWTRRWDGKDKALLIGQDYDLQDDREHIQYLMPFFKDPRYIKINNKPVFLMYRSESHPFIQEAVAIWQNEATKAGFDGLYLIRMENFIAGVDPALHGFDAGMEFAPERASTGPKVLKEKKLTYLFHKALHVLGIKSDLRYENGIYDYDRLVRGMIEKETPSYTYFRCLCPGWDNSPRRKKNAIIYINSNPEKFKKWLEFIRNWTEKHHPEETRFLFINAWNEWAEGCHLEPDEKWGHAYLHAVKDSLGH